MSFDFWLALDIQIINIINFYFTTFATHTENRFAILNSPLNIHTGNIIFTSKANQIKKETFSTALFKLVHFYLSINQRNCKYAKFLVIGGTKSIHRFKTFQIFLF